MKEEVTHQENAVPKEKYVMLSIAFGFIMTVPFADIIYAFFSIHNEYKIFAIPVLFISVPLFMFFIYYAMVISYKQKMKKQIKAGSQSNR